MNKSNRDINEQFKDIVYMMASGFFYHVSELRLLFDEYDNGEGKQKREEIFKEVDITIDILKNKICDM